jgi:small-conductance mechanosensitive channel
MGRQGFALGTLTHLRGCSLSNIPRRVVVNNIIYIVGLVVVVLAVLAFFGLR